MKNTPKNSKNSYYIYGKHPVHAALLNPNRHIETILCTLDIFNIYKELIAPYSYTIITNQHLTKLLGANHVHQGIAAKVQSIFSTNIEEIDVKNSNCKIAILDQITDPQNIGSIIRSAASFGINAIILPADNAPDENSTIAKAASGTLELVQIIKVTNLRTAMEYLKKHDFWIIGLDGQAKQLLDAKLLSNKVAIVLGSEDKGLRRLTSKTCDYLAKIPISQHVESLNVANAASIAFYLSSINIK